MLSMLVEIVGGPPGMPQFTQYILHKFWEVSERRQSDNIIKLHAFWKIREIIAQRDMVREGPKAKKAKPEALPGGLPRGNMGQVWGKFKMYRSVRSHTTPLPKYLCSV